MSVNIKLLPRCYTIRFISGYYTFQFVFLLIYLSIYPDSKIWNTDFPNLYMADYLDNAILAYLLFQSGVLIASLAGKFVFPKYRNRIEFTEYIKENHKKLVIPLIFGGLVIFLYPIALSIPVIGFVISSLFNFMNLVPFVAGILFFHNKGLRYFWFFCLLTLFSIGILTGGRGIALLSIILYLLGFYYSLVSKRSKRLVLVSGIFLSIPFISFIAFVGIFRNIVGRVSLEEINFERAIQVYNKYEKIKDSKIIDLNNDEAKIQGWGRFVNFVNFTEFATVPSQRSHLGFDGFFNVDLPYAFDISFISGSTVEDRLINNANGFRLNDYGYYVTLSSSVEYSIVTESYIRFGYLGILLFSIIISFFSIGLEYTLYISNKKRPVLEIFCMALLFYQAILSYAYPIFIIIRNMFIAIIWAYLIVSFTYLIKILFWKKSTNHTPKNYT